MSAAAAKREAGREALLALATGAWRQVVLALAVELDLFALLGARAADLEEVCYSLGTQRQPTLLFLAACEGLGLIERHDEAYSLAPLGRSIVESVAFTPADWARTTASPALRGALRAVLEGPLLGGAVAAGSVAEWAPVVEPPDEATAVRSQGAWTGLHAAAAEALASMLVVPCDGLIVELGGRGLYLDAMLGRTAGVEAALVEPSTALRVSAPTSGMGLAVLPSLDALGERRASLAVIVATEPGDGVRELRERLTRLPPYLHARAPVVVVGSFLAPATAPRAVAPLLSLAALAAGRGAWCPTSETVAGYLRTSGLAETATLVLPEPDVAVVGYKGERAAIIAAS